MVVKQLHKMDPTEALHYTKARPTKSMKYRFQRKQITNCMYCGESHAAGKCKAYGQVCIKCNKENHLAKVCMSNQRQRYSTSNQKQADQRRQNPDRKGKQDVRQLEDNTGGDDSEDLSSDESVYALESRKKKKQYFAEVVTATEDNASQQIIKFQLDTGATCSTLTPTDYKKLTEKSPEQSKTEIRL
jgi:hypothetical protein